MHLTLTSKRFRIRCWWPSTLAMFPSALGSDTKHDTQEVIHANRNGRPRQNGSKHGAASVKRKPPMPSLQQIAKTGEGVGSRESSGSRFAGGFCKEARQAPNDMVDGAS